MKAPTDTCVIEGLEERFEVIGVDGEGYWDTENRTHVYDMVSVGSNIVWSQGHHLTMYDVVDAIREKSFEVIHRGNRPVFVGFFLNYDFTQWIRSLSPWELTRLHEMSIGAHDRQTAKRQDAPKYLAPSTFRPSLDVYRDDDGYSEIDDTTRGVFSPYRFKVRFNYEKAMTFRFPRPESLQNARALRLDPTNDDDRKVIDKTITWIEVKIQDMGSIFGCSFVEAVQSLNVPLSDTERNVLIAGKAQRGVNCTREQRVTQFMDLAQYNQTEIDVTYRLFTTLAQTLTDMGIVLRADTDFDGIGTVARIYLAQQANVTHIMESYEYVDALGPACYEAANKSFSGGNINLYRPGIFDTVYGYDINSAYPATLSEIPNFRDANVTYPKSWAEVERGVEDADDSSYYLVHIAYHGTNERMGGLNYRNSDYTIIQPPDGQGWYWAHEVIAAQRAGLIQPFVKLLGAYRITPVYTDKPFAFVGELYTKRHEVGKKTALGHAIKLVMNSIYGKVTQQVGNPRYASAIVASLVTAGCRTQILNAIATHPVGYEDVVMVATDGVFFTTPHPYLDLSDHTLGAWGETVYHNEFFLKSGIWGGLRDDNAMVDENKWSIKTRGLSLQAFINELDTNITPALHSFYNNKAWDSSYVVKTMTHFSMLTLPEAIAQGEPTTAGEFTMGHHGLPENLRELTFTQAPKRTEPEWDDTLQGFTTEALRPWIDTTTGMVPDSTRPERRIGNLDWTEFDKQLAKDQPIDDRLFERRINTDDYENEYSQWLYDSGYLTHEEYAQIMDELNTDYSTEYNDYANLL